MKENTSNLTDKQEKAIIALMTEPTIKQAAERCQIGETTLYRWLNDSEFNNAYKRARKEALNQTITRLQQETTLALDTLREIMLNEDSPASTKVTSAKTILEMNFKAYEMFDQDERIKEIEEQLTMLEGDQ